MGKSQRSKSYFVCFNCGYESVKWLGRCPNCGEWNTFKEFKDQSVTTRSVSGVEKVKRISEIEVKEYRKILTGIYEFDRVLDEGITPSSLILIGGEPGIGKSTLLLQIAKALTDKNLKVLYVSGEESPEQVKGRAARIGACNDYLFVIGEQHISEIKNVVENIEPLLLIIDSIQTIYKPEIDQVVGSVTQVRECGAELLRITKERFMSTIIVGHVTKDGTLAGPKTLEHMVDVVLYLEGERSSDLRILRCTKNRYGGSDEIGIFEMTSSGLREVSDAATLFISKDHVRKEGIAYTVLMEGRRPILAEIQSLVLPTFFPTPQRVTTGFDTRRLHMILAVVERFTGINLRGMDIFLNVTGGIKVEDSSADLAVVASVISSYKKKVLPENAVFIGEVGLGGEVRWVANLQRRIEEAKRLGFMNVFSPVEFKSVEEVVGLCLG